MSQNQDVNAVEALLRKFVSDSDWDAFVSGLRAIGYFVNREETVKIGLGPDLEVASVKIGVSETVRQIRPNESTIVSF